MPITPRKREWIRCIGGTISASSGLHLATDSRGAATGNEIESVPVHLFDEAVVVVSDHDDLLVEVIHHDGNL